MSHDAAASSPRLVDQQPTELEFLRALVDSDLSIVVRWLPDGTMTWVSPSVSRILGVTGAEFLGQELQDFYLDDELTEIAQQIENLTPASPTYGSESELQMPDGSRRWIRRENRGFFVGGELVALQTIGIDVTETRRALETARASERRLLSVLDHLEDAILLLSPDGEVKWLSPSIHRVLGGDWSRLLEHMANDFSDDDLRAMGEAFDTVHRGAPMSQARVLTRPRSASGNQRHVELFLVNMLDVDGINAIAVHARDVTARERAGTIAFETYLRELLTDVREFVLHLDEHDVIRYASPCFEERVHDAPSGMTLRDSMVTGGDDISASTLDRLLVDVRTNAGRRVMSRIRIECRDGVERSVELTGRHFAEPEALAGIVVVGRILEGSAGSPLAVVSTDTTSGAETADDVPDLVERFRRLGPADKLRAIVALKAADPAQA